MMICTKTGFLKPHSRDLRVWVTLHGLVLFLLLVCSCGGDSQVTGTSQQVVAMLGEDTTLPCYIKSAGDAGGVTLEWARSDLDPRFVLLRRGGVELEHEKHQMYAGRSSLSTERLKCGDVSLKLSEVKLSDSGTYRCHVPTPKTESETQLIVGSISSPRVHISAVSNGVSLDCRSKGWFPQPEVLWLDGEGRVLTVKHAETVKSPDGLFTVSSKLTVDKKTSNSFTCRVQQEKINQTRETHVQIPVEFFLDQSSSAVRIFICVVVSIIPVVAVVLVLRKWGPKKTGNRETALEKRLMRKTSFGQSLELLPLVDGQSNREKSMVLKERMKYLDNSKVKQEEKLEKTQEELEHVEEVMKTLTDQKTDLKTQREKLIDLQKDDRVKIEENKKKLKDIPKTQAKDKMEKREKIKDDLKKRSEEHDELFKSTEKLLESTDGLIYKMTERKGKLEKDKEQINKHLREIQRQREETQRELEMLDKQQVQNQPTSDQTDGEETQVPGNDVKHSA